jgi:hypothetical protein
MGFKPALGSSVDIKSFLRNIGRDSEFLFSEFARLHKEIIQSIK